MTISDGHLRIFYPTHISCFLQCPERYFRKYVERRKVELPFGPNLAKGIADHQLLSAVAAEYQRSLHREGDCDGPAVPCDLQAQAEAVLPRAPYPSDVAWQLDVRAIVEEVKYGISYLDGHAQVLASEQTYQYPYLRAQKCPRFILAAKVDLVLLRYDAEGHPYLDVVDFKSGGSIRVDPIQELAARIVVKQNATKRFAVPHHYIQSTTVYLRAKAVRSEVLEIEECGRRWNQVKQVVAAILAGKDWSPTPSPLCEWCPFFTNGCSLMPEGEEVDDVGEWLDGAAD